MYDAIVIGARCAGAVTAMLPARKGHRVLLVDRSLVPSDLYQGHFIHKQGPRLLAQCDAARRFPEECLCEGRGVCAYSCFILSCVDERNMNCRSPGEEPDVDALLDNIQLKIPAESLARIYELRRVFRLCM